VSAPDGAERRRLDALDRYAVAWTPAEPAFDRLTRMAARVFGVPISLVTLLDADTQHVKSRIGLDVARTPREHAFCDITIRGDDVTEIPDAAADPRTSANPLVLGDPWIRYYAGAPLVAPDGSRLGAFCLVDRTARRPLDAGARALLADFAALAMREIELRAAVRDALALLGGGGRTP